MGYRLPHAVLILAALLLPGHPAIGGAEEPPAPAADWEARLKAVEERNRALAEQYEALLRRETEQRTQVEQRYRDLERKYETLKQQVEAPPELLPPALEPEAGEASSDSMRVSEAAGRGEPLFGEEPIDLHPTPRLEGLFEDGFLLQTDDEELQLRFHVLDQTDFKVFVPGNQSPTRSGLYIPRVRFYFEGRLTRGFEYEVSLQRSVEGTWDLLDGNINLRPSDAFQIRFGRTLVPYSYDWYDHLEQYFITPERGLFPLNFGLSRSAGLMGHGRLFDEALQYAVGGFDGRLQGIADNNTTRDAVGYLNWRPFLRSDRNSGLRYLNLGVSGFLGQQVSPRNGLPLRTSLQSSDNDEAAEAASAVFLKFAEEAYALGDRSALAIHLAWYRLGTSLGSEFQAGRFGFARADGPETMRTTVPVSGFHVTLGQFITGETITDRSMVVPVRPFAPWNGEYGPGAIELFGRYSRIQLGDNVFTEGLANPRAWTNEAAITDIGLNWYPNRFVKLYFDWQHSLFGSEVLLNPNSGLRGRTNDLFWIRCQFYF